MNADSVTHYSQIQPAGSLAPRGQATKPMAFVARLLGPLWTRAVQHVASQQLATRPQNLPGTKLKNLRAPHTSAHRVANQMHKTPTTYYSKFTDQSPNVFPIRAIRAIRGPRLSAFCIPWRPSRFNPPLTPFPHVETFLTSQIRAIRAIRGSCLLFSLGDLGHLGGLKFSIPTQVDELHDLCVLGGKSSLRALAAWREISHPSHPCHPWLDLAWRRWRFQRSRAPSENGPHHPQIKPQTPAFLVFFPPSTLNSQPSTLPQPTLHNGKFPRRRFRSTFVFAK
jgi:hypothetical protein